MKKVFCILSILTIISPVLAEEEATVYESSVATAEYVRGAYDELSSAKQDQIAISAAAGAIVTAVTLNADGKTINVARTNEVSIPVGSVNSATRARIWVQ